MARARRKTAEQPTDGQLADQAGDAHYAAVAEHMTEPSFDPSEFDPEMKRQTEAVVQSVADATRIEPESTETPRENGFTAQHEPRTHAPGHIANPSSRRRESHAASVGRRLPSTLSAVAGDLVVSVIDRGNNLDGIGIRVEFPDGRRPTAEELEIIREHMQSENGRPGLRWDRQAGIWHAEIVRQGEHPADIPPSRPVAVRLSVEGRVERLAQALREHQEDPMGFAEQVRQRREQAANGDRVPD
jgi:hypothetical protein